MSRAEDVVNYPTETFIAACAFLLLSSQAFADTQRWTVEKANAWYA